MIPTGVTHISFDMWNTLIVGNVDFKPARLRLIGAAMGCFDMEHLFAVNASVEHDLDASTDKTGKDFDFVARVHEISRRLNLGMTLLSEEAIAQLRSRIEKAFMDFPPVLIESTIARSFARLQHAGYTLGIISNTGFLSGMTMRRSLQTLGILDFFNETVFSDEVGIAKPHQRIFRIAALGVHVDAREILHIGDNIDADYWGAKMNGMHALLFDPKNKAPTGVLSVRSIAELAEVM